MLDVNVCFTRTRLPINARFALRELNAGLFGPSGSGKSSLLRLLSGQWTPDSGRIMLGGDLLFDSRRGIKRLPDRGLAAMVDREERLDQRRTVLEHLTQYKQGCRAPNQGFTADEVIDLLSLRELLPFRARHLSAGETVRVLLGRTLLAAPRLLLLDESLSSIDQGLRMQILAALRDALSRRGLGLIHVSHHLGELLQLTDRVIVMLQGAVVGCGTLPRLMAEQPLVHAAGIPQINNVLRVTVTAHDVTYRCTLANLFGNRLVLPFMPRAATGSTYQVGVRGEDIALSKQPLQGVSIQNQIKGRVCAVLLIADRALVQVDAGAVLVAEISQRAVAAMNLREGDSVYCLIKAQAFLFLAGDMVSDASETALKLMHTLGGRTHIGQPPSSTASEEQTALAAWPKIAPSGH